MVPFYGSDDNGVPEPGDWAGLPGKGFAKVLQNGAGQMPVLFIEATEVSEDTRIAAAAEDSSQYLFDIEGLTCSDPDIQVRVTLTWRRAWRAMAVAQGWTTYALGNPWELELKNQVLSISPLELTIAAWDRESFPTSLDGDGDGLISLFDLLDCL